MEPILSHPWVKWVAYGVFVVAILGGLIFAYKMFWGAPAIKSIPLIAKEAPQAAKVQKIFIPGPVRYQVYNKAELVKKIPVPAEIAQDKNIQFNSTAAIQPSPYGGTAVGFTNMTSGKSGIVYTPKARPWYGFGGVSEIGAGLDMSTKTGTTGVIEARQDIIRLWGAQVVGKGEIRASPQERNPVEFIAGARIVHRF
jgi:hypothetical protein